MKPTTRFANNANANNSSAGRHHSNNNNGGRREGFGGPRTNGAPKKEFAPRGGEHSQPMPTSPNLSSLDGLNVTPASTVPIIDPTGFGGLIHVPVTKTFETKGRYEFFKGILRKEVSLCCLFQKGRCHAGDKCHQIHVDTTFIKNVRAQNANIVSCCRACKDTASLSSTAVAFFASHFENPSLKVVAPDGRYSVVRSDQVALTTGLSQHVEQQQLSSLTSLPTKKMCRLHLRGACKYGKDCKNIHLCTKLGEDILSPTNTPAPEERRGSLSSNAATSKQNSRTPTPTPGVQHQRSVSGIMDRGVSTPPPRAVSPAPLVAEKVKKSTESAPVATDDSSRRASIVSVDDAPKDYFNSSRFQTPEDKSVQALSRSDSLEQSSLQTPPPATQEGAAGERRLSFSQVDLSNVSFMENSVAMNGLCFDPSMALQTSAWDGFDFAPKHQPKKLSAEWLVDDLCGCSSTASQSATPTPAKATW